MKDRIFALFIIFSLASFLLVIRLFYWQVIKAAELTALATNQRESVIKILPSRGKILTSDNFPLVSNQKAFLLFANPLKIPSEKREKIFEELSPLLLEEREATFSGEEREEILKKEIKKLKELFDIPNKVWLPLKHKISLEKKLEIEKLAIDGLGFEEEEVRFYPEASMAAHLLGFVGANLTGEATGYFGLEGYYDLELKGKKGVIIEEKDAGNFPIIGGFFNQEKVKNGKDLVLHLDRSIQLIAEQELKKGINKYGAKSGYIIIMEPFSGAILALASFPAYHPAEFLNYEETLYKNPAIAELYEPGSTFKILVMAAALNEAVITPQTRCEICEGPYKIDKYLIKTWNEKYYPDQTMVEVLEHSDNVGMVFVSQKLGKGKLIDYLKRFGIGEKTGIDLQEEVAFPLKEPEDWNEVDLATASFGQGLAVTGIQMARAVAAIANGGNLLEPHLVHKIVGEDKTLEVKPKTIRKVLKEKTTQELKQMMMSAVDNGEAKWAKPKGYKIAGKTGTAQVPVAGHYDKEKTIASFVGFAPVDQPKFLVLVYLREPTSSPWASETAAPLFFNVVRRLFLYLDLSPEEP